MSAGSTLTTATPLVMIVTGDGKGKTTSAFGQALRAAGSGMRVAIIQFITGSWDTGEVQAIQGTSLPITIERTGKGFVDERLCDLKVATDAHKAGAREGLELARAHLSAGELGLLVLDEILTAIQCDLVTTQDVVGLLGARTGQTHVLLTGRGAPREPVALADLVSEIRPVRHHYQAGVVAQRGIEF